MAIDHAGSGPRVSGFTQAARQAASIPAVVIALAATGVAYWLGQRWWDGAGEALRIVPVFYAIVVLAAALCVTLLSARARLISDHQAAWVAAGVAAAGLAALAQAVEIMQLDSPLAQIAADGQAALYLVWHAALVIFTLGAVIAPTRKRLRLVLSALFATIVVVTVTTPAGMTLPNLVTSTDAFTPLYQESRALLTVATLVALVAWVIRNGRRPTWPQVWITVMLILAGLDLVVAATADHLFESIWWSSAALRAAQFAVPAVALLVDSLRLMRLLHQHEQHLNSRLEHERAMAERLLHDRVGTAQDEQAVRAVLQERAFHPVYQPIYSLASGELIAVEALTRFTGSVQQGPDVWFDQAWRCGLGIQLELATLDAAIAGAKDLPDGAALSVNVSPASVIDHRCAAVLAKMAPTDLIIEITEHAAVDDYHALGKVLKKMQDQGVRVAIDDAGAGFSSLQHVVQLSPDIIKLDMSLTRNISHDPVRRALAISLIGFATQMGITMIAEGVETTAELTTLGDIGADAAQGYLLGRPSALAPAVPATEQGRARARALAG